jgi:broad specificity phosphatase PhoE
MKIFYIVIIVIITSCSSYNRKIFLVRHAEQDWNYTMLSEGRVDAGLSIKGKEQSYILGKSLSKICKKLQCSLYASNAKRAKETAEIISQFINKPIIILDNWHERVFLNYSKTPYNLTKRKIMSFTSQNEMYQYLDKIKNSAKKQQNDFENDNQFTNRAVNIYNHFLENYNQDQISVIIAHKYIIEEIIYKCHNKPVNLKHTEFIILEQKNSKKITLLK